MKKSKKLKKSIVIFSLLLLFLQLMPYEMNVHDKVSAEPDVIDNGDNTMTATWDFFNPNDYIMNNTTMNLGVVSLESSQFWWNQTSYDDFNSPGRSFVNTTVTASGDVRLISTINTTNLLINGTFSPGLWQVWNHTSSGNITSKWNSTNQSVELNFSYYTQGPIKLPLTPPMGMYDGNVANNTWDADGWTRDDSGQFTFVGYEFLLSSFHFYYRTFFYFDITAVPDDALILDVTLFVHLTNNQSSVNHTTDIYSLEDDLFSQTDESLYWDCGNGTLYINDSKALSILAPEGGVEWDLGETGRLDVTNNLTTNLFGLGLIEEGDDDNKADIGTFENLAKQPKLNITYSEDGIYSFNETAYINQTFTKTKATPDIPDAVNLSFDYALENITHLNDTRVVIYIDGSPVWIHNITDNMTWNHTYAHVGEHMTEARDYNISIQLQANVSTLYTVICQAKFDNFNITTLDFYWDTLYTVICQAKFDNFNITTLDFYWDGNYTSTVFDAGAEVLWDEISWGHSSPPPDTMFTIRTRVSDDNISWSQWSDEYINPMGQQIFPQTGRYIQYTVNLSTTNFEYTPLLHDVSLSYWKNRLNGTIEMAADFMPENYTTAELVNWGTFVWEEQTFGQNITITYWYSIDGGQNWTLVPLDGNLSNVNITSEMIRFKAEFTSNSTVISPSLIRWILTYEIGEVAGLDGQVDPVFGFITNWYNLSVNYSDPEGDPPQNDIVLLNITDGASHLGTYDMVPLDPSDTNYNDGKIYYFNDTGFDRAKYTYNFEAQDDLGFWSISSSKNFWVVNSPPKITTSNDPGADEGSLYYVNYTATDLEDENNLTWSHSSNATWLTMNSTTGELEGTPTSADRGYYWVNVTVIDGYGGLDWTNFTLWVGDEIDPIADAGSDGVVFKDIQYTFNGTNSSDNSGVLNYTWYFGDGSIGYGPTPSHVYNQSGLQNVFLFVTDPNGNEDWTMINITVRNSPPVADAGPDQTVFEGETVFFNGSNSYDTASDIDSLIYRWDFDGDGIGDKWGTISNSTWYNERINVVKLRVIDKEDDFDEDEVIVTVQNVAPTVDIEDFYQGTEGSDIIFIARGYDPGDDTLQYQWDWENDGVWDTDWSTEFIVDHTWSSMGTYTVMVRVTDGVDFGNDTATVNVTVRKEPPIIGNLGIVKVRYNAPYIMDLTSYVSDADTDLGDLAVWTDDPQNITVDGLKITLEYSEEVRGETIYVNVFVSDGEQFDNSTLGVEVTANYPPTLINPIPDVEFYEDNISQNEFNLNDYFEDQDGETLEFEINHTSQFLYVIKDDDGWVSFWTSPNWAGTELVIFRAEDPNNAYIQDMILVTVIPVNDPPIALGQIQHTTVSENKNWTINLHQYFIDIDSPLEFSCNNPEITIDQLNGTATWTPGGKKELKGVIFTADDGEYSVSLDPVDLKVPTPTPFNWLLMILPFILGLLVFAVYREIRYRYTIEEVFLVDNAGVLLVHMSRGESKAIDAKLVSGMLTAVQEFVKDSFMGANGADETEDIVSDEGTLGKLEYGDFQIVMERGNYTFLSAVISGYDNKRLRNRMRDVVEEFEEKYKDTLADWDGDMSKFDGAEKIVGTLLKQAPNSNMISEEGGSDKEESIGPEDLSSEDAIGLPFGDTSDVPSSFDESAGSDMNKGGLNASETSIKNDNKDIYNSGESKGKNTDSPSYPDKEFD
jgi:hypothetical protein